MLQIVAARLEDARLEAERVEREKKDEMQRRLRIQEEKEVRRRDLQDRERVEAERLAVLEAHKRQLILEETRKEEELRKDELRKRQDEVGRLGGPVSLNFKLNALQLECPTKAFWSSPPECPGLFWTTTVAFNPSRCLSRAR